MKKIINNNRPRPLSTVALALLWAIGWACSGSNKAVDTPTNSEITESITTIKAVGKVVPASGWTSLSTTTTGVLAAIYVQEGDSVVGGQVLATLHNATIDLDLALVRTQLQTLKASHETLQYDIARERLSLADLKQKYDTSTQLFAKHAETKEKLDNDRLAYEQQQQALYALEQQRNQQQLQLREQQLSIQQVERQQQEFQLVAPHAGVITELLMEVGQSVTASSTLGQLLRDGNIFIEAEVDELFANKIAVGQSAKIFLVGRQDSVAQGVITYAAQTLSNKSILYETIGEAEDRRVRRIRIKPSSSTGLLVNAKVDCEINLSL